MLLHLLPALTLTCLAATSLVATASTDRHPRKRQIYREQVLPHAGGRIPDTAFESDRLFLNQLQKDGIAVPDGIVPEQRNPQVYPFFNRPSRKVYRIALSSDGRFTPQEGRYHFQDLPAVDTTYLFPQIYGQKGSLVPQSVKLPVYRPFRIHNPLLNQLELQPKDKAQFQNVVALPKASTTSKAKSYQNFNILNSPLNSLSLKPLAPDSGVLAKPYLPLYDSQGHHFNDFDDYFRQFDVYDADVRKLNSFPAKATAISHQHSSTYSSY